jgi:hypothetical protein
MKGMQHDRERGTYYVRPPLWETPSPHGWARVRYWWGKLWDWYHGWRG